jgi:hypothetical protein
MRKGSFISLDIGFTINYVAISMMRSGIFIAIGFLIVYQKRLLKIRDFFQLELLVEDAMRSPPFRLCSAYIFLSNCCSS